MKPTNHWANPSQASPQDLAAMAAALEERGRALDQQPVNAALIEVLAPAPGERLLEAGSGTGMLCRQIAAGRAGRVTGLDISPGFIYIAQAYAAGEGLAGSIQWCAGQVRRAAFRRRQF